MSRLMDKCAVMLLCFLAFSFSDELAAPVVGILCTVAVSGLVMLFSGTKLAGAVILIFSALCLPFPMLFCASPIMLFDAAGEKRPWLAAPALLAVLNADSFSKAQLTAIIISLLIAGIYSVRIYLLQDSVDKLLSLRNEVEEKNLLLKEKNLSLADAADNEAHLATLRERNRIAREIHDNVGHMLTRSLLQAGALMIINKDETLKQPLSDLRDTLNTAMTSIRESVHDLHDESVDLDSAIRESINSVGGRFQVSFDNDSEGEIPVRIRLCLLAVIKEGISNAVKHSKGSRISINIRQHPAFYQLTLEDNGSCTAKAESSGGIGLQNMRDRAEALGGRISFTPSPNGFKIFMTLPSGGKTE